MNKVRLEILGLSASHSSHGSFALVLGEVGGKRRLPIIIGMFEAQAIALEIEKISSNRPMTHDLFKHFVEEAGYKLHQVIISELREGIFYASMHFETPDGQKISLDARPSDAVAIGIRFDADLYTVESVMEEAGIKVEDLEEAEVEDGDELDYTDEDEEGINISGSVEEILERSADSDLSEVSDEKLKELMQAAVQAEDYEKAAIIRDEMKKRGL